MFSMPSVGGIGGRIKRFKPCEGALKSALSSRLYSLPTLCCSSVALGRMHPFPVHYGWHFLYLWSASQGSWLLQQHLLNNNRENIKRTEFLFLVCGCYHGDEIIFLWEGAEHSETKGSPSSERKTLEILVGRSSTTVTMFTSACLHVPLKKFQCFKYLYAAQSQKGKIHLMMWKGKYAVNC